MCKGWEVYVVLYAISTDLRHIYTHKCTGYSTATEHSVLHASSEQQSVGLTLWGQQALRSRADPLLDPGVCLYGQACPRSMAAGHGLEEIPSTHCLCNSALPGAIRAASLRSIVHLTDFARS